MNKNLELQLREAYFTLWQAVEDGIDTDKFFELRETFRGIQQLIEEDDDIEHCDDIYPAILKEQNS